MYSSKLQQCLVPLALIAFSLSAQTKVQLAEEIVSKAKIIYALERASWIGGDSLFNNKDIDKSNLESYISYVEGNNTVCVFYTPDDSVLAEYRFDTVSLKPVSLVTPRKCSDTEVDLITIKRTIKDKLKNKKLKKVKLPAGTSFNYVPIIFDNQKICYLINATNSNTIAILGRDYKIVLDKDNNIRDIISNHRTIQEISFDMDAKSFIHTHVISETFSETEIATLMLYKNFIRCKEFTVIGKNFISVWSNITNTLTIN